MADDTTRAEAVQMSRDLVAMIDSERSQMPEAEVQSDGEQPEKETDKPESPYAFAVLAEEALDDIEEIGSRKRPEAYNGLRGIQTGFTELDALTGGLTAGTLTILASRPAMGRTTLACDIARHAAIKTRKATGFLTLQESLTHVVTRVKAAESRIMRHHMRSGTMTDEDWQRLARKMPELVASPLFIRHMSTPSLLELILAMKEWVEADELALLVIDGIEEIGASMDARDDPFVVVHALRDLAVELGIPVVATAQVHRLPGQRYGKIPHTDDLHEAIAFTADNVILLHREDAYEKNAPRQGEADLILAKHRQGPEATITVAHQLHYSRFVDMAQY